MMSFVDSLSCTGRPREVCPFFRVVVRMMQNQRSTHLWEYGG